jgi:nickel-dependent lactate racemase
MQSIKVPWAMYYSDDKFDMTFPDSWSIEVSEMAGGPDIGDGGIREAFANPIGSPKLSEIAKGKASAAILIDDLTRPTPADKLIPYILEELAEGGIHEDQVRIIAAVAAHRAMIRPDFIRKLGKDIVDRMQVICHNADDNLDFLGHSSRGIPLWVNRDFMSCQVRIALGMITPRGGFFGGGAKLVLPGASGRVSIAANHRYIREGFREHLDEVARIAGLNFLVNPCLNPDLEIDALVTGDPVDAYWEGVEIAKKVYASPFPEKPDIAIFNAWPKDAEFTQAGKAMVPVRGANAKKLKDDTTVVIATASPEGMGFHSVFGAGAELKGEPKPQRWRTIIFSPNLNKWDVLLMYGEHVTFCKTWDEVIAELKKNHGDTAKVSLFPYGSVQYCE